MNSLVRGRNLRRCFLEFMVVILLDDAFQKAGPYSYDDPLLRRLIFDPVAAPYSQLHNNLSCRSSLCHLDRIACSQVVIFIHSLQLTHVVMYYNFHSRGIEHFSLEFVWILLLINTWEIASTRAGMINSCSLLACEPYRIHNLVMYSAFFYCLFDFSTSNAGTFYTMSLDLAASQNDNVCKRLGLFLSGEALKHDTTTSESMRSGRFDYLKRGFHVFESGYSPCSMLFLNYSQISAILSQTFLYYVVGCVFEVVADLTQSMEKYEH